MVRPPLPQARPGETPDPYPPGIRGEALVTLALAIRPDIGIYPGTGSVREAPGEWLFEGRRMPVEVKHCCMACGEVMEMQK